MASAERATAAESTPDPRVPLNIWLHLNRFMLDKRTGNVVLNIRDGEILKAVFEDHVRAS
jgi:hypothetical protein